MLGKFMQEKKFTLSEIKRAILQCPVYEVHIDANPSVDDSFPADIKTIEIEMFLFRLFNSNFNEYKNSK
jgi:hypothetical protein